MKRRIAPSGCPDRMARECTINPSNSPPPSMVLGDSGVTGCLLHRVRNDPHFFGFGGMTQAKPVSFLCHETKDRYP